MLHRHDGNITRGYIYITGLFLMLRKSHIHHMNNIHTVYSFIMHWLYNVITKKTKKKAKFFFSLVKYDSRFYQILQVFSHPSSYFLYSQVNRIRNTSTIYKPLDGDKAFCTKHCRPQSQSTVQQDFICIYSETCTNTSSHFIYSAIAFHNSTNQQCVLMQIESA